MKKNKKNKKKNKKKKKNEKSWIKKTQAKRKNVRDGLSGRVCGHVVRMFPIKLCDAYVEANCAIESATYVPLTVWSGGERDDSNVTTPTIWRNYEPLGFERLPAQ